MAENRTAPSRRALLLQHLVKTHGAIAEEAKLIVRQRQLITDLERDGGDTREAWKLLSRFEDIQRMHIGDRDRMEKELAQTRE